MHATSLLRIPDSTYALEFASIIEKYVPTLLCFSAGLHPNGFSFEGTDAAGLDYALNRALSMYYSDRASWNELAADVMQQDWSWDGPALDYLELYYKALKGGGN